MKWRRTHSMLAPGARSIAVLMAARIWRITCDDGRRLGAGGGLRIASASSPRSMPMVASNAIISRPVIGWPVCVVAPVVLPPDEM